MAKPAGPRCNLACRYCFYRGKERLYPGSGFRMADSVMEAYVRQTVEAQGVPRVTVAWQGGEPALMGLDFFRRSIAAEKNRVAGITVERTFQTNGTLIDGEWCRFFREHRFLVGLSLDGPCALHDAFRRDRAGGSLFDRTVRAAQLFRKHGVEYNILCTVNAANSGRPLEVYRFFRDGIGARYIQFIPVVERGSREGAVTACSVRPEAYGRFLIEVFDEWVGRDVGEVFVTLFDGALASWLWGRSPLCIFREECGDSMVLEHNGDLYSCDHFVDPDHLLGNILETPLSALAASEKQREFGRMKSALPRFCRECGYLFACHGECPKNRLLKTPDGEPGLNWLCAGLKAFFAHADRPLRLMAGLLRRNLPASDAMKIMAASARAAGNND